MLRRVHKMWWFLAVMLLIAPIGTVAQEIPTLAIAREHVGDDCVAGVLTVQDDFVAYVVAIPYKGSPPRLAALDPGMFNAQLSGNAEKGWEITYEPSADQGAVQLHLGRATIAGVGDIAIGDDLASDGCHFAKNAGYASAARAFEQHLRPSQSAPGKALSIRLKIEDR